MNDMLSHIRDSGYLNYSNRLYNNSCGLYSFNDLEEYSFFRPEFFNYKNLDERENVRFAHSWSSDLRKKDAFNETRKLFEHHELIYYSAISEISPTVYYSHVQI
jgi:hypothetical protein